MKRTSFVLFLSVLLSMAGVVNTFAYDAQIDGIYYNFSGTEAEVTSGSTKYSGDIEIPSSVEYNEVTYTVTTIADYAFQRCTGLTSVTIPNSVTSIGVLSFSNCHYLTSISIPESVTSIGNSTFSGTAWYNNLPDGLIYAGKVLYQYKGTMPENTSITIEPGTASISDVAFSGCSGLISVTIPESVTSIGYSAFSGCSGLISVTIPESVTSIDNSAFSGCSGLTSITFPENLTSIGGGAFDGTAWYNNLPDGMVYINKVAYKYKGTMPSNTSITLESGTVGISASAFYDCSNLASITIPNSVTTIGSYAFWGCTGLTSVTIGSGVTSIGDNAFQDCFYLYSVIIPNSVTSIGEEAFCNCYKIKSITIPESVTSIGNGAFIGCFGLTSITIPETVTSIGNGAFSCCSGLNSIVVDAGNIKYDSRGNCNAIIETESNTLIAGCKNSTIPESVTGIGDYAFYGCSGLTSITIPNSVTSIGEEAFCNCYKIKSITIPESVTSIGNSAFTGCYGLTSITIPNSVTSIGDWAFSGCSGLTSVVVDNSSPLIINFSIFENRANATLYVPYGSKSAYEAADYWNEFKEIVEISDTEITIGSSGIATYSHGIDLDFTDVDGLKAYIASGYSPSTGELTMTRVYKVPAGEGLLLKGAAGSYDVPYADVDNIYANMLVGVPTATTVSPTDEGYTNLVLANGSNGIGFYTLSKAGEIAAGKAYLQIPTSALPAASARKVKLLFEDEETNETTGVSDERSKMEENGSSIYSLSGQRVEKPAKGLYIKNGKKIMIK